MTTDLSGRRFAGLAVLLVLASGISLAGPPRAAGAAPPAGGMSAAAMNTMVGSYADSSGRWASGDGTASVLLPDGRVVWLFSDSLIGPVNPDHSLPGSMTFVNNAAMIQDGGTLLSTLTGGTAQSPTSLVPTGVANEWYWIGDAIVEGTSLKAIYHRNRKTGSGALDFEYLGAALVTFSLPALTVAGITPLPLGDDIAWGSSLFQDGGYTYVYGTEGVNGSQIKFAHVARAPAGNLGGAWQFWTGSGWSSSESSSARLLSGVQPTFGMQKVGTQYVMVTMEGHLPFNSWLVAYTAPSPTGPFSGPVPLYQAPEPAAAAGKPIFAYSARLHPDLARAGKLLISYDVNSLDLNDVYADVRNGRPRFAEVTWPPPAPDPAAVPARPATPTAVADDEGRIDLTWQPPAGSGLTYWVYRRDVTAGQTHFAREIAGTTQPILRVDRLLNDHTYEFKVAAANAAGEGVASVVVTAVARVRPPSAPTGVTVSADITGRATVSWSAVTSAWNYEVSMRDVTAGESSFAAVQSVDAGRTSAAVDWLDDGHEYEFVVAASNGGGTSGPSAPARVLVRHAAPGAPAGLRATANDDGTIALSWDSSGAGIWYWIYQRDVTAGEADFTRLGLPVTTGTSMTAGYLVPQHEYEYKISAVNRIGEGPAGPVVRASSRLAPPAAPTALTATPEDGAVKLSWTASATGNVWYVVEMRNVSAGESGFTRLASPVTACCTMTAGLLTNGDTYQFRVAAIDGGGGESAFTNVAEAVPHAPLPSQVTGVSATAQPNGEIRLQWTSAGAGLWYDIHMRDVTAGETDFRVLPLPVTTCCSFTAGHLTDNHVYQFRVAARSSGGAGPVSAVVQATSTLQRPAAPTNLRGVTAGTGAVDLTWDAPAPDLYYYAYWRNVTRGETTFTRSSYPISQTSTTLGLLQGGDQYEFKVTAANGAGEGPASAAIRLTVLGGLPAPPTNLTATPGDGQAVLRWTASPTPNVLYNVYLRDVTAGASFRKLDLPVSGTSMTAGLLTNDHVYEFYVTATNSSGDSAGSNRVTVRPMPPRPQAPTGLQATAGDGRVTLRWTASTTPNVFYAVEMRSNGGSWRRLKDPVSTCCTFVAGYLTNGTRYEFRMYAVNAAGDSANPSNVVAATPLPPVAQPPTNLTATAGAERVTLRWTASPTANVWYSVYMRDASTNGAWRKLPLPVTSCCTFVAGDLVNGHTYQFRVTAFNVRNESAPTNTVSARPTVSLTQRPTLNGASTGSTTIRLWWTAVANAEGYHVEYIDLSANGSGSWKRLEYPVYGTSFDGGYLASGKWYRWRVIPMNGSQTGPAADPVEIRTRGQVYYFGRYALGDSYSAGLGGGGETGSCLRSSTAWPLWLTIQSAGGYHLACSGGRIPDVRANQLPATNQPGPTIISMTIGGNDAEFANELKGCILGNCLGREASIASRVDGLLPALRSLYRDIRSKAPGADIVIAGYPLLVTAPGSGRCAPATAIGLSDEEHRMIRRLGTRLNGKIRQAASEAGVTAVVNEVTSEFAGHEACASNEYIHQVVLTGLDSSFHPNQAGQRAYQRAVDARMGAVYRYGAVRY